MRLSKGLAVVLTCAFVAGGCRQTNVYSDAGLTQRAAVQTYSPKPIVFVSKTDACQRPLKVDMKYLPDLERPQYVVSRSGLGKSGYVIDAVGGVRTGFEQKATDLPLDSLITSVGNALVTFFAGRAAVEELDSLD